MDQNWRGILNTAKVSLSFADMFLKAFLQIITGAFCC